MKFILFFIFSLFFFSNTLYSQINLDENFISKEKIGLHVGTFTNEIQFKKKINNHFITSLAFGYSNYTLIADVNLNNNNSVIKLNTDIRSFKSNLEYIPSNFLNLTFFTGLSYFSKFDLKADVFLKDNIKFGDIDIRPDVVGISKKTKKLQIAVALNMLNYLIIKIKNINYFTKTNLKD